MPHPPIYLGVRADTEFDPELVGDYSIGRYLAKRRSPVENVPPQGWVERPVSISTKPRAKVNKRTGRL